MPYFENYYVNEDAIKKHNLEAEKIWNAYNEGKPLRIPVVGGIIGYKIVYLNEESDFRKFYNEPEEMMRILAEAKYANERIIISDDIKVKTDTISAGNPFHTILEGIYWGCPTKYEKSLQAKQGHLYDKEKIDPDEILIPDPFKDDHMIQVYEHYRKTKELVTKGYQYLGYKFTPSVDLGILIGTIGLFNTALQMRGTELYLDLYEDPDYVKKLMNKVAEGYIARSEAWLKLGSENGDNWDGLLYPGRKIRRPIVYDHGIDMMSMDLYREFLVPVYDKVKKAFGQDEYDSHIEHCGRGEEVVRFKHKHFGVNSFSNISTSYLDVERLLYDLGDEVEVTMTTSPETLLYGPKERIIQEVKEALRPEIKKIKRNKLKLYVQSSTNFTAPVENVQTMYEAVKEYGWY